MRTSPLLPAPQVRLGPDGWRPPAGAAPAISILAAPGTYTVKLSADGRELAQPLVLRKDPNSAGSEADIQAQTRMLLELRRDLNAGIEMVNRLESVRSQLEAIARLVADADVKKAAGDLGKKYVDLEMRLYDLRITGGQDGVRYGAKLLSRLSYLANGLSVADFAPTDQQAEVQKLLAERLRGVQAEFSAVTDKELSAFNTLLRSRNIENIVAK
jgi:hypothetical protein